MNIIDPSNKTFNVIMWTVSKEGHDNLLSDTYCLNQLYSVSPFINNMFSVNSDVIFCGRLPD